MEAAECYAAVKDFVNSLRRSGHSDAHIVEVVRESFVREVCKSVPRQTCLPAVSCAPRQVRSCVRGAMTL
jgi:hypothetical protein